MKVQNDNYDNENLEESLFKINKAIVLRIVW